MKNLSFYLSVLLMAIMPQFASAQTHEASMSQPSMQPTIFSMLCLTSSNKQHEPTH